MNRFTRDMEAAALVQPVSPELLRELLLYCPETGRLFWRHRGAHLFANHGVCARWNGRYAGKEAFTAKSGDYYVGRIFDQPYKSHRVAWAITHGMWPKGDVDHVDNNPSNNKLANLRDISHSQNAFNQRIKRNNTSGHKNVLWSKADNRWVVRVKANGKTSHFGSFHNLADAAAAAERGRAILHGEFARST